MSGGDPRPPPLHTRQITLPGTDDGIQRALEAASALWAAHGLSRAVTWPVDVSLDEVLANIAHHARGPRGEEATIELAIELDLERSPPWCEVTVSDNGPEFDPLAAAEPDLTLEIEDRPVGGLGIALFRRLMEEVSYRRSDGRNLLRMRRRLVPVEV